MGWEGNKVPCDLSRLNLCVFSTAFPRFVELLTFSKQSRFENVRLDSTLEMRQPLLLLPEYDMNLDVCRGRIQRHREAPILVKLLAKFGDKLP